MQLVLDYPDIPYEGLEEVWSGGQTGVDEAGLAAAKQMNIKTGGYAPLGFKRFGKPDPVLLSGYGLIETEDSSYVRRTELNVQHSDATLRLASDFSSPGQKTTLKYIRKYGKPYFDIDISHQNIRSLALNEGRIIKECVDFMKLYNVRRLNIAGNRDKRLTYGYHYHESYFLLLKIFEELQRN